LPPGFSTSSRMQKRSDIWIFKVYWARTFETKNAEAVKPLKQCIFETFLGLLFWVPGYSHGFDVLPVPGIKAF
jgi:hypothetical protein